MNKLKLLFIRYTGCLFKHAYIWGDPYVGYRHGNYGPFWLFQLGICARCNKYKVREIGQTQMAYDDTRKANVHRVPEK